MTLRIQCRAEGISNIDDNWLHVQQELSLHLEDLVDNPSSRPSKYEITWKTSHNNAALFESCRVNTCTRHNCLVEDQPISIPEEFWEMTCLLGW